MSGDVPPCQTIYVNRLNEKIVANSVRSSDRRGPDKDKVKLIIKNKNKQSKQAKLDMAEHLKITGADHDLPNWETIESDRFKRVLPPTPKRCTTVSTSPLREQSFEILFPPVHTKKGVTTRKRTKLKPGDFMCLRNVGPSRGY